MTGVEHDANDDTRGGFGMVPRYLRGQLTCYELAVYAVLSMRISDETGTCWLRHKRLAEEAGCSIRTVRRALDGLREKGHVTWEPHYADDGKTVVCNDYTLHVLGQGGRSHRPGGGSHRPEGVGHTDLGGRSHRPTERESLNESPLNDLFSSSATPLTDRGPDPFVAWWDVYDKKVGRKKAEQSYRAALRKPGVNLALLYESAKAYIAWQRSEGKHPEFTKHPATWLNGECWNDELPAREARRNGSQPEQRRLIHPTPDQWEAAGPRPDDPAEYVEWHKRAYRMANGE